jgi:hypothetical protein
MEDFMGKELSVGGGGRGVVGELVAERSEEVVVYFCFLFLMFFAFFFSFHNCF